MKYQFVRGSVCLVPRKPTLSDYPIALDTPYIVAGVIDDLLFAESDFPEDSFVVPSYPELDTARPIRYSWRMDTLH